MKSWTFDSPEAEATLERGEDLGRSIGAAGLAIALVGPLGAGKTVFVKGLAKGLGVDPRLVSSPTFVIAQQYPVARGPLTLHHVDLYRLESEDELETIGFYDMLAPGNVVAVEWADRFDQVLGRSVLSIEFEGPSPEEADALREDTAWRGRRARVTAHGGAAERILSDWAARVEDRIAGEAGSRAADPGMRVLALLLIASGTFLGQRFVAVPSSESNRTACPAPIAVEADPLGTLRAVCGPIPSESLPPLSGIAQWLDGHPIDLNEASEELLQRLPAVGPARAAAIVRERTSHRFTSVRDLERVSGIGPRIRTSLASWLSISERTVPSGATLDLRDRSGRRREALDG